MYDFVCSIVNKEMSMSNISYKGNNKNLKKYPKLINPLFHSWKQTEDHTNSDGKEQDTLRQCIAKVCC